MEQISAKKMAQKVSNLLKAQNPNYDYLRDVFRFVRENLNIEVTTTPKRLPYVPTEDEIRLFTKLFGNLTILFLCSSLKFYFIQE